MHLVEFERQVGLEQVERRSGGAVAGVDDDFQVCQRRRIDKTQQLADVIVRHVDRAPLALLLSDEPFVLLGNLANVLEAGIAADRPRLGANHLEAVVIGRVVAGRHHDAAIHLELACREINHLGAADADIQYVTPGLGQALGNGGRQRFARVANIAAQHDALRVQELGGGVADAIGNVRVELVRDAPANIIGLEAVDRDAHGSLRCSCLRGRTGLRNARCRLRRDNRRTELR